MATPMANGAPSEDYCRCCLTEATDLLFDVFSILEESKGPICELIATLCGIIISEKDGESKNICGDCLRDLVTTYRFRERCLRVNRILKVKSFGGVWVVPSVVKRDPEWNTGMLAKATQYVLPKSDKESQTEKVAVKDDKQQMKTFGCYECRSKFTGKSQLMNHIRIHKCPFQCNVCFRRFKLSGDLMLHRSSHHGSDAYDRVTLKLN